MNIYNDKSYKDPNIRFHVGDFRDIESLMNSVWNRIIDIFKKTPTIYHQKGYFI